MHVTGSAHSFREGIIPEWGYEGRGLPEFIFHRELRQMSQIFLCISTNFTKFP
jgi:hypothetical protein